MRSFTLVLGLSWLLASTAASQSCGTEVTGEASGTWTRAGSPYCVVGRVTVSTSLTIEAGVRVLAAAGASVEVTGALVTRGTAVDPVVFTARDPQRRWNGLGFSQGAAGSSLTHTHIENAGNSGVRIDEAFPVLTSCRIRSNTTANLGGGLRVRIQSGELALRDCIVAGNTAKRGGGIHADLGGGRLRLERCRVADNTANETTFYASVVSGGGLCVRGGALELRDCEVVVNRSVAVGVYRGGATAAGGGLSVTSSSAVASDCLFAGNSCEASDQTYGAYSAGPDARGGAISSSAGPMVLTRCVLRDNGCRSVFGAPPAVAGGFAAGGAIYASGGLSLDNCLLAGNSLTAGNGAGGAVDAFGTFTMVNCTVTRNETLALTSNGTGVNVFSLAPSVVSIVNSIAYGNLPVGTPPLSLLAPSVDVSYSDVQGGYAGVGNLDTDPRFRGPPQATTCGALELDPQSPCVDAGDPAMAFEDVAFPPSLGGLRNDMGAQGGPAAAGWFNWERPTVTLGAGSMRAACPTSALRFTAKGGSMTQPVAVFVEAINGVALPGPVWIPPLGTFCAAGRADFAPAIGAPACSLSSVTFRAYSLTAGGALRASNAVVW